MPRQTWKQIGHRIGNGLLDAFFPPACLLCRRFYNRPGYTEFFCSTYNTLIPLGTSWKDIDFAHIMSRYLCPECISEIYMPVRPPICPKCGVMHKSRAGDDRLCEKCLKRMPQYGMARSFGEFEGKFKELIYLYKYRGKMQLRKPFGILAFYVFMQHWKQTDAEIVATPVPLHIKKLRKRGFNQSYFLIRDWKYIAERFSMKIPQVTVEWEMLEKNLNTKEQAGADMKKRRKNVLGAFSPPDPFKIKGKNILLVDDVLTSGATVEECTKTLLAFGAANVDILTLARTMKRI